MCTKDKKCGWNRMNIVDFCVCVCVRANARVCVRARVRDKEGGGREVD